MKIVPFGSSGTVLTSFRFLTSTYHFWAQTQCGLRMFHELRLKSQMEADILIEAASQIEASSLIEAASRIEAFMKIRL